MSPPSPFVAVASGQILFIVTSGSFVCRANIDQYYIGEDEYVEAWADVHKTDRIFFIS